MFRESKNLKDTNSRPSNLSLTKREEQEGGLSYTKTHKLITALYMVTDIIDKDEPLRNKLRTLGIEILSDITSMSRLNLDTPLIKISEIMSFLDIASAINIISEMNTNILRKEFSELNQSIQESTGNTGIINRKVDLVEFFETSSGERLDLYSTSPSARGRNKDGVFERGTSIGHHRIGVQKGNTLLKALSDKNLSDIGHPNSGNGAREKHAKDFLALKKQRHDDITNIIKIAGGSATIKDIKDKVQATPEISSFIASSSEKTLQRELASMVKNGVLNKTGEKRWSRYFIK